MVCPFHTKRLTYKGLYCLSLIAVAMGCTSKQDGDEKASPATSQVEQASPSGSLFDAKSLSSGKRTTNSKSEATLKHSLKFSDVAASVGLDFVYRSGAVGESLMVETMGGGAGALDFDCDGRVDLIIPQGGKPTAAVADKSQPKDTLYRLMPDLRFVEIGEKAGLTADYRYSMGVTIGDYDDDGFDDVLVTNYDDNQLFKNLGDGTFVDVTALAGVNDTRWSCSAAFADLNGDMLLDLYVANYVDYNVHQPRDCRNPQGKPRMCHPRELPGVADECYINRGDGSFSAESVARGLVGEDGKGLGVAIADFDRSGSMDIYVANDTTANFLFVNAGDGKFHEKAKILGCAMDRTGAFQASMGLGIGDYNRDGLLDIYSTHFYDESNTLYKNLGSAGYQDVTAMVGLHDVTLPRLAFGTVIEDFDQNGLSDIFVANGHIENNPENQYHRMQAQLFTYNGRRFVDESGFAGPYFETKVVGRGVCSLDYDDDGDLDLAVVHQDSDIALLRNDSERGSWLNFSFRGRTTNRRGIGCWVTVEVNGEKWEQQLYAGGSYASYREPILAFGFGELKGNAKVQVKWPSGIEQVVSEVALNQHVVLDEPLSPEKK